MLTTLADPQKQMIELIRAGDASRLNALLKTDQSLAEARNKDGVSLLVLALYHGRSEIALILADAKKNPLDIYEASSLGDKESAQRILSKEPGTANSYSPDGFTPLGLASHFGRKEIVELLLVKGAEVNAVSKNPTGFTALTGALSGGHSDIVRILVAKGANVNHRYEAGFSPLMVAAEGGDLETVKLLLSYGADATAQSKDGRTAMSIATEKGHAEVANLLKSQMEAGKRTS